jgi:hypothetical protein
MIEIAFGDAGRCRESHDYWDVFGQASYGKRVESSG